MLLKSQQAGTETLVEVKDLEALINPQEQSILGQIQNGEEEQEPEPFTKSELMFPSGEALPKCWFDANYKLNQN
jgi:hypothetical protein